MEKKMNYVTSLFDFIEKCPTALHTVDTVKNILTKAGYTELSEADTEKFSTPGRYFVVRGGSSIIAFASGDRAEGFTLCASHTDTPSLKVTGLEEKCGAYAGVPVEKYGGSILYSWLDRPLSLAGRVVVRTEDGLEVRLVNVDSDLLSIPSIAIHQNRTVNDGYKFNPAIDMLPLLSVDNGGGSLKGIVADSLKVSPCDIISSDLYVYNRERGRVFGKKGEFILSPRLDNLASVYSSLTALLESEYREDTVRVFCAFDNEEVGNSTKQGANSTFLKSVLEKIAGNSDKLSSMLQSSFMVSLDNSHASHPNHPELANPNATVIIGKGVAVKYHAGQLYTTDAVSDAIIRTVAGKASVSLQSFATRADMLSGSTLGSVATTRLGISSVDLGIPQLAMHSASETMGTEDFIDAVKLLKALYSSKINIRAEKITIE